MQMKGGRSWIIALLLLGTMACSLSRQPADSGGAASDEVADTGGSGAAINAPPPVVEVVSPASGQQVVLGTDVEIQVNGSDQVGITSMQLLVANRVSSTKSFPEPDQAPQAILRWRPDRRGTFELSVVAFSRRGGNLVPSAPVTLTLQVLGRDDPVTNPVSGQPQTSNPAGACSVRVLISNLRVRTGPGTNFDRDGFFNLNEELSAVGRNFDAQNEEWFKVRRSSGTERWVINNSNWVALSGDCANLPVVE